jgi:hypothetical protein
MLHRNMSRYFVTHVSSASINGTHKDKMRIAKSGQVRGRHIGQQRLAQRPEEIPPAFAF